MGILEFFGTFLKKYGTLKLGLQAHCGYFQMCPFFGPELGQNVGFRLFFLTISTGFTWNLISKLVTAAFGGV